MSNEKPTTDAFRLPDTARPIHYDLTLSPDFDDFTFSGEVE